MHVSVRESQIETINEREVNDRFTNKKAFYTINIR